MKREIVKIGNLWTIMCWHNKHYLISNDQNIQEVENNHSKF